MLHKTKGIVFHTTRYSETSVIAKVYTELFGLQSYMINGVRSKKAKIRSSILQPLSLLEMVVYHKDREGLQRVSEIKVNFPFKSIPFDNVKSSIVLFLKEVLIKSIKEEEANNNLFEYITNAMQFLDLDKKNCNNFHLYFMLQLTKFLGFYPNGSFSKTNKYFDLKEGNIQSIQPPHNYYIEPPLSEYFQHLLNASYDSIHSIPDIYRFRKDLLKVLITYYELHIPNFSKLKSLEVLEEVMS